MDHRVGGIGSDEFPGGLLPLQRFAFQTHCHGAEQDRLGHRARVVEIRERFPRNLAADRVGEVLVVVSRLDRLDELVGFFPVAVDRRHAAVGDDEDAGRADHERAGRGCLFDHLALGILFLGTEQGDHLGGHSLRSIIPGEIEIARGECIALHAMVDEAIERPTVAIDRSGTVRGDLERRRLSEPHEPGVINVATHVAERPGAIADPLAPVAGVELARDEFPHLADADPFVPVERRGRGLVAVGQGSHRPPRFRARAVDRLHLPDDSRLEQLHRGLVARARCDLDAHLGHQLVGGGELAETTRFLEGAGEGLLAVDVFTKLHRRHRDGCVQVVGRADHDRIDLLVHLVEKFAPVLEDLRAGMGLVELLGATEIDLGHGDEGRIRRLQHFGEITPSPATSAEVGEAEIAARSARGGRFPTDPGSGEGGGGGGLEEVAARGHGVTGHGSRVD